MITELGGRAVAVRCDVTRSEDVQTALNQAVGAFGRLDVAFNNAGAEQKAQRDRRCHRGGGTGSLPSTFVACSCV